MGIKPEGKTSEAPLAESFAQWSKLKIVILALIGGTASQAVVWCTGLFHTLLILQTFLTVDGPTANILMAISLVLGTPFFILFGSLPDKIGRKPIIMAGSNLTPQAAIQNSDPSTATKQPAHLPRPTSAALHYRIIRCTRSSMARATSAPLLLAMALLNCGINSFRSAIVKHFSTFSTKKNERKPSRSTEVSFMNFNAARNFSVSCGRPVSSAGRLNSKSTDA